MTKRSDFPLLQRMARKMSHLPSNFKVVPLRISTGLAAEDAPCCSDYVAEALVPPKPAARAGTFHVQGSRQTRSQLHAGP